MFQSPREDSTVHLIQVAIAVFLKLNPKGLIHKMISITNRTRHTNNSPEGGESLFLSGKTHRSRRLSRLWTVPVLQISGANRFSIPLAGKQQSHLKDELSSQGVMGSWSFAPSALMAEAVSCGCLPQLLPWDHDQSMTGFRATAGAIAAACSGEKRFCPPPYNTPLPHR